VADMGRAYDAESQIVGTGDGWVTLSGTTESFSSVLDMEGYIGVEVAIEVDFASDPTDDVDAKYYPCRDSTPTNPDDIGKTLVQFDNGTDPNQQSFDIVSRHRYLRIGLVQTGSTDSHNVRAYARKYKVAST